MQEGRREIFRQQILGVLTGAHDRIARLHDQPALHRMRLVLDIAVLLFLGAVFVVVSTPFLFTRTLQDDFQKTARIDEDGLFRDSYHRYQTYYSIAVAALISFASAMAFSSMILLTDASNIS